MKKYSKLEQDFQVRHRYQVHFTNDLFDYNNPLLQQLISASGAEQPVKVLFVIDEGVSKAHEYLTDEISAYARMYNNSITLAGKLIVPGGERVKNEREFLTTVLEEIDKQGICRHSFVIAVGGGALLDMAGFAAAVAHRGVRLIRVPTTVLSQNDSGIGVKNSVNWQGKKNFLGSFAPPYAVINDWNFLSTLDQRDWISGTSEAVKVALIKDPEFFHEICNMAEALKERDVEAMKKLIYHCARLHVEHIGGGDPFEQGSSRPLDFGHWAAHKLEQLTNFEMRHGEAVAVGMAIDITYAYLKGMIGAQDHGLIVQTLEHLGFDLQIPAHVDFEMLFEGIGEFREHLGGALTITLISGIGIKKDVHEIDKEVMSEAVYRVRNRMFVNQL
ncbi:3-dehydroquinate synthase [Robertkochia flava]|uniref:3-dehydroquinate synthase n=1 Tax=Robertkochia flava TaxID=3447986 RepID=UPI001CCBFDDD|nr:3-dehydroquinate synthase [Robertkochia marina]